jgi:hypothetical protein
MVSKLRLRISEALFAATAVALSRPVSPMEETRFGVSVAWKPSVELSLPDRAVTGLPCLALIYVRGPRSDRPKLGAGMVRMGPPEEESSPAGSLSEYPAFPQFDLLEAYPPLSVRIVDAPSKRLEKSASAPPEAFFSPARLERASTPEQVALAPGETRGFVLDVSVWLADIPAGKHAVALGLHNLFGKEIARSNDTTIEVASLPEQVWHAIQSAIPQVKRDVLPATPWGWLEMKMDSRQLQDQLPKDVFSHLALYCFLSDVAHEGKIEKAPTKLLDNVPGHLEEFAAALRYEVLLAKGEQEAAKKLKDAVFSKSTAMKWRFDESDAGNGLLQQVIKRISPTVRRQ